MKRFLGIALALVVAGGAWSAAAAQDYGLACGAPQCSASNVCVSDCPNYLARCEQMMGRNFKYSKGFVYTWQGFPGGCVNPGQAQMLLEKRAPSVVCLGDAFTYEIQVSNRSDDLLGNVSITDTLPAGFEFVGADPGMAVRDGKLNFVIGDLPPRSAKTFKVSGKALQNGCLLFTGSASASFQFPLNIAVNVTDCALEIQLNAGIDDCGDLCEPIPATICVKSTGSGASYGNKVTLILPDGLTNEAGETQLAWDIGDLAPGQSKTIPLTLKATRLGNFDMTAIVVNARGKTAASHDQLRVRAPNLQVEKAGPVKAYVGRNLTYQVSVTNKGDCPAKNVQLIDVWSGANVKVLSVTPKPSSSRGKFVWNVGILAPGETFTAVIDTCAIEAGNIVNKACATAFCADMREAAISTEIVETTGVLSDVVDLEDPLPVDCNVVYVVTAKNQGGKPATNIKFTAKLDSGMEFVEAQGPTPVTANGDELTFAPVASLDGGQKATWKVLVRATPAAIPEGQSEADKRFVTYMTTDQLDSSRPVVNGESTTIYQTAVQVARSSN